jgi:hypothetical protein
MTGIPNSLHRDFRFVGIELKQLGFKGAFLIVTKDVIYNSLMLSDQGFACHVTQQRLYLELCPPVFYTSRARVYRKTTPRFFPN